MSREQAARYIGVGTQIIVATATRRRSQDFYRQRKHVADAAFRPDELRLARIAFDLAAQPQDLDIHAAVEHLFFVHADGGKQLFAAQHLLGRALERDQEVELACACLPST